MAQPQFWTQIFQTHIKVGYCGILPSFNFTTTSQILCRILERWGVAKKFLIGLKSPLQTLKRQFVSERGYSNTLEKLFANAEVLISSTRQCCVVNLLRLQTIYSNQTF